MELACGPLCSLAQGWISGAQCWDFLHGVYNFLFQQCGHTTNPQLLQGLLYREDGLRCCVLGKGHHRATTQWKHTSRLTIKLAVLSTLFEAHLKENMVVVNVNGGAHFTHLGLKSYYSRTSRPFTRSFHFTFPKSV